jgi:hypothetical protein
MGGTKDEASGDEDVGGGGDDGRGDRTVVLVSRDYLIGALGRSADALLRAGDVGLEARRLVTAGAGTVVLIDLKEHVQDLRKTLAGLLRALDRVILEETPPP